MKEWAIRFGGYILAWTRRKRSEIAAVFGLRHKPEFSFYMYHALVRKVGVDAASVIVRDSLDIRSKEADPEKVRELTMKHQHAQIVMENIKPQGSC